MYDLLNNTVTSISKLSHDYIF